MNSAERDLFVEKLDEIRKLKADIQGYFYVIGTTETERDTAVDKVAKLQAENAVLKRNVGLSMDWVEVDGERVYTKPRLKQEDDGTWHVYGDVAYVKGDVRYVEGDVGYVQGDVGRVEGNVTHVKGEVLGYAKMGDLHCQFVAHVFDNEEDNDE